jgi:hypothetical protein
MKCRVEKDSTGRVVRLVCLDDDAQTKRPLLELVPPEPPALPPDLWSPQAPE